MLNRTRKEHDEGLAYLHGLKQNGCRGLWKSHVSDALKKNEQGGVRTSTCWGKSWPDRKSQDWQMS